MKIKRIETFSTKKLCIVRVTSDDGQTGWGQTAHNHADITCAILHEMLAPVVLGMECEQIETVNDACIESTYKFYGSYINRAAAGIDTALWDMMARKEQKSVCQLLGGTKQSVNVYASSMDKTITPAQEADRMERLMDEKGFRAFKLHIAKGLGRDEDVYPGRTEQVVRLVRESIGDSSELYVDPNGAFTPEGAICISEILRQHNVGYFEEPCPFWRIEDTAKVAHSIDIPVAGGEQDFCLSQWQRIVDNNAVAIAQPDICYIGGLTRALRVSKMTQNAGLLCTPHNGTFGLLQVFSIHFAAAIQNAHSYTEFSIDQAQLDPWTKDLFFPQFEVKEGSVLVPQGPGWGVEINPDWLSHANYRVSDC